MTREKPTSSVARRLAEARDVATAPARLEALRRGASRELREALASNPSTPPAVLIGLLGDCPAEVVSNAVWPLVVLGDPGLGERTRRIEAGLVTDPERLRGFARIAELGAVVAANPATPGEVLEALATRQDPELQASVARHARCPAATLERLAGGGQLEVARLGVVQAVAGNEGTPGEVLTRLARHVHNVVRERVAGNGSTPAGALRELASDRDPELRLVLAGNRSAPVDLLAELARDPDGRVREVVAGRMELPDSVRCSLLADGCRAVRRAAIAHPSLPLGELDRLVAGGGPDAIVARLALRERRATPKASRRRLG